MKEENILIKICLIVLFVLILAFTFFTSLAYQIFDHSVSDVVGDILWTLIYFVMPAAVLVSLWFFRKKMLRSWICLAVYIFIAAGTYFAVHGYLGVFTTEKWEKYTYERCYMLDDFTEKYSLETMTKDDMLAVLGEPDYITDGKFNYNVERGWLEPIVLLIRFGENEKVAECFTYSKFEEHRFDTIVSAE